MQYTKIRITDYRAIAGPLEVDVERNSLIPIIGINESGKTTILHAIFAFDSFNDRLLHDGQHLKDTQNLYRLKSSPPRIAAQLALSDEEYATALKKVEAEIPPELLDAYDVRGVEAMGGRIWVTRDLEARRYELDAELFPDPEVNSKLGQGLVNRLPYVLFFDDFRDSIDEVIPIVKDEDGTPTGWLAIFEELFRQTDPALSVLGLADLDERQRESAISEAVAYLNRTLTNEWTRFGLDGDEQTQNSLRLDIKFVPTGQAGAGPLGALKLQVIERTAKGGDRYFYLLNRSKGFYWFCNFVLKLEFNPKSMPGSKGAIYLLDEPGSYLHNSAQARLCEKLRQLAEDNTVIYCTHSQYLLNPEVIPLNTIHIAAKDDQGQVGLVPYHEYPTDTIANRWAYQPLWDALRIKPFLTDLSHRKIVVVEGVTDYYAFEMFKTDGSVGFVPGVNADSLEFIGTLLLGWNVDFVVLWDNDNEGRRRLAEAEKHFGEEIARRRFRCLPFATRTQRKRILQDLFAGDDLAMIRRRLGISEKARFRRTIEVLYYDRNRATILGDVSPTTRHNFAEVMRKLPLWDERRS